MSFPPLRDPRGARPLPAPCASGGSDSCLIRARPAARAVRIPPFPLPLAATPLTGMPRPASHRVREEGAWCRRPFGFFSVSAEFERVNSFV
jgi:hypothetical protein